MHVLVAADLNGGGRLGALAYGDRVAVDVLARGHARVTQCGKPLQAWNGHDPVVAAYEEALDQVVYLQQAKTEGQHDTLGSLDMLYEMAILQACRLCSLIRHRNHHRAGVRDAPGT